MNTERATINHATLVAANALAWDIIHHVVGNGVSGKLINGNDLSLEVATRRGMDIIAKEVKA